MRVEEIAKVLDGIVAGDGKHEIQAVASLETAGVCDLTFAEGARSIKAAAASHAGCILVPQGVRIEGKTAIQVKRPKLAFVQAAGLLAPKPSTAPGVHPTAVIHASAVLEPEVFVGPGVVIERGVRVGKGTKLGAGVFLGENSRIGSDCRFFSKVTIYPGAIVGNRVILHAGVVIGADGFGYVTDGGRHLKFPQIGEVILGDDVEVGANTTIDRGSLGKTMIGDGTKIDNLVQVAHNVHLGRNCLIAAQTGISGSTEVGDNVVMGGQVGVGDHVRIESNVSLGGQAGVLNGKIVRKGTTLWGTPARPLAEFKKMYARLAAHPAAAPKPQKSSRRKSTKTS